MLSFYSLTRQGVDLVVTTYESYLAEQGWFKRAFVWRYVVLDEGHKVKVSEKYFASIEVFDVNSRLRMI